MSEEQVEISPELTSEWMKQSIANRYSYNFEFLGRPIIQYPQDMVALQELIWEIKPDLIIETGIAHGGSLVMSAAMLALLEYCDCVENGTVLAPSRPSRRVVGIDIDIRDHNRKALDAHPMRSRIELIQGSSIDPEIVAQVRRIAGKAERVLVCLDSNHSHDHVLGELKAYADLTSIDSYCVVFDTIVEDLPGDMYPDRNWGPGNNPKSAVHEFLKSNPNFTINKELDQKLKISVAPDGYLLRVS